MKYTIQAFSDSSKTELIGDWSSIARRVKVETSERGNDAASMFVPMSTARAFNLYALSALPHLVISYGGIEWVGRIEDIAIANGGVNVSAFGYWRAMSDTLYTALWSDTSTRRWENLTVSPFAPEKFVIDFNNRLSITAKANEGLDNTEPGGVAYRIPDKSTREIVEVTYTYEFLAPNSTWQFRQDRRDKDFVYLTNETTVTGTGATITATVTTTLSASSPAIGFVLIYNSGTAVFLTNTGDVYVKITAIRVKTKTGTIYADDIVTDMIAPISSSQLSQSPALIQSPAVDLEDAIFEDMTPAEVVADLEYRGDSNTPPRVWTSCIYSNQLLQFKPANEDNGRQWYTDIQGIELQRTIDELSNSVYTRYQDENGRRLRTDTATNSNSVTTNGIERTYQARANTTSATQANLVRDAELNERGDIRPRSSIFVKKLYNSSGASVPLIMANAGDRLTIRNLPNVGAALDNIKTFTIARTQFNISDGELEIVPSRDLPSVAALLAQSLG